MYIWILVFAYHEQSDQASLLNVQEGGKVFLCHTVARTHGCTTKRWMKRTQLISSTVIAGNAFAVYTISHAKTPSV